jgi:hypothetical protein
MNFPRNPDQQHAHGSLFEFVHAPPRYKRENPRKPSGLLGKVGTVLDGPEPDGHEWGGLFSVLVDGNVFQYYGDFMRVIS